MIIHRSLFSKEQDLKFPFAFTVNDQGAFTPPLFWIYMIGSITFTLFNVSYHV